MSPLWLIPGLIAVLGAALVLALVRSAAEEARLLADELGRQREVGAALGRLLDALGAAEGAFRDRR